MGFRFKNREAVEAGLKRIAREQIDRALEELADRELDRHDAVHQVRKRCKKLRGVLRLVRPVFESDFDAENAWYRDAARHLSWVRDAQSSLDSFVKLAARYRRQLKRSTTEEIGDWLADRRDQAAADEDALAAVLDEFRERLVAGRARIGQWELAAEGFEAVAGGLATTYGRGRRAMAQAYESADTVHFHEWRKRVKYHWYHLRLLQTLHPALFKVQRDQAARVGELLGEEHDLALLRDLLDSSDVAALGDTSVLLALVDRRRKQLRRKAHTPGMLLYCEKPKQLVRRLGCYWQQRRDD